VSDDQSFVLLTNKTYVQRLVRPAQPGLGVTRSRRRFAGPVMLDPDRLTALPGGIIKRIDRDSFSDVVGD
ncbi:MAG TPA: hypothetical protein VHQ94_24590, partial [Pyrinomonadaceae bacterium]|nr:hypothetical protein [Pyrinomonadaceae bacterium]